MFLRIYATSVKPESHQFTVILGDNYVPVFHFEEFYLSLVYLENVNINQEIHKWLDGLLAECFDHKVAHAMLRNFYTGPSLHGFPKWADDVMLCAKCKVWGTVAGGKLGLVCAVHCGAAPQ